MANSLEPQLEPVAPVQTPETSEGDFSSFVASEFSSDESSENNLEDIQGAQMMFYLTSKKLSMKWMLMLV